MSSFDVVRIGPDRLRVGPWRGDPEIAQIMPTVARSGPRVDSVRHCLGLLASRGFRGVVTSALATHEQEGFLRCGFDVQERLQVLTLDLPRRGAVVIPPPAIRIRRARRRDRPLVLAIDSGAFSPRWRFDETALDEALGATPTARMRLAESLDGSRGPGGAGYVIAGRSRSRGFLQRLAVAPEHRNIGLGGALVVDVLDWLARRGVRSVVVNTQVENHAALHLYGRLGFTSRPEQLLVLGATLDGSAPDTAPDPAPDAAPHPVTGRS